MKNFLHHTIRIIVGLTFLVSALTKLFPVEPFQYSLFQSGFVSWIWAPIVARLIIGMEFILGVFLIFNKGIFSGLYVYVIGLLFVFTGFLVYDMLILGNNGDCGCFGTYLIMSNRSAILKNIVLMGMCGFASQKPLGNLKAFVKYPLILVLLGLPFILNFLPVLPEKPIRVDDTVEFLPKTDINGDTIYYDSEYILAFLSTRCAHCKSASEKLSVIRKRSDALPMVFVLTDEMDAIREFSEQLDTTITFIRYEDEKVFYEFVGGRVPTIFLIKGKRVYQKWNGSAFDAGLMLKQK